MPTTAAERNKTEPIPVGQALDQLLDCLQDQQPVARSLRGQLKDAMRRQWDLFDDCVRAEAVYGKWDARVERSLDRLEEARGRVSELVAELDAAGDDGKAVWRGICQERWPAQPRERLLTDICVGDRTNDAVA